MTILPALAGLIPAIIVLAIGMWYKSRKWGQNAPNWYAITLFLIAAIVALGCGTAYLHFA